MIWRGLTTEDTVCEINNSNIGVIPSANEVRHPGSSAFTSANEMRHAGEAG
jgi:hypothetical protein